MSSVLIKSARWIMVFITLTGCAGLTQAPPDQPSVPAVPPESVSDSTTITRDLPSQKKLSPRALAALTLIDQGRGLIDKNRPDDAIRILEKAMSLHPKNGKVYYYLAEAWLLKGDAVQASEFNRLAEMHLQSNQEGKNRIERQKKKIQNK